MISVKFDAVEPTRVLELFCSPKCRELAQRRRHQLRTALAKIDSELTSERTPTPRLRIRQGASVSEQRRLLAARKRARKPTKKDLQLWRRRVLWELDALDRRPPSSQPPPR